MKISKRSIIGFVGPVVLFTVFIYIYPVVRTVLMGFFSMDNVIRPMKDWTFVGLDNYINNFNDPLFVRSLINIFKLIFICGAICMVISYIFAVAFTMNIRFKKFFRAIVFLPNVIAAIAIGYMWIFYVFNQNFGLLKKFFTALGLDSLANLQWLSPDHLFLSMSIAMLFANIGYYMMMFIAGIEKIPVDYYEAATIEGSGTVHNFFNITLPLSKGVFSTALILWTSGTMSFFALSQVFSGIQTYTPALFIYYVLFGTEFSSSATNSGLAASAAVIMTISVLIITAIIQRIIKDENYEL